MINGAFFWGLILLLFGCSLVLKGLFGIDIPLVRVFIGFILIYAGFIVLTQRNSFHFFSKSLSTWTARQTTYTGSSERRAYTIAFGSGEVDLSAMPTDISTTKVVINVFCGEAKVIFNPNIPTLIKSKTFLGSTRMPNGEISTIQTHYYKNMHGQAPRVIIKTHNTLGSLTFVPSVEEVNS